MVRKIFQAASKALPALIVLCVLALPAAAKIRVGRLLKDLKEAQGDKRIPVVMALGRSANKEAVEPLLGLFDIRQESPRLSAALVEALGRLGDDRAEEPLIGAWDYMNSMRLQLGEELPAHLQTLRAQLIEALGSLGGDRAVTVLQNALNDKDPAVVQKAAWAMGKRKETRALEALVELVSRGGNVAQAAFEALGEIGDERVEGHLDRALKHQDPLVQVQAAYALFRLGREDGEEELLRLMNSERQEPRTRLLAAYYLARLDNREALDYLFLLLKKGNGASKAQAAEALGKSGNQRAVLPLAEGLRSSDASQRLLIVRALGRLGGSRAVYTLYKMEDDDNPSVRAAARQALVEMGEYE